VLAAYRSEAFHAYQGVRSAHPELNSNAIAAALDRQLDTLFPSDEPLITAAQQVDQELHAIRFRAAARLAAIRLKAERRYLSSEGIIGELSAEMRCAVPEE
jgi:hypothetical protein